MIEIEVQNETHQTQERLKFVAVPRIGEGIRLREPDGFWTSYDVVDLWYQKAEFGDIWVPYLHVRITPAPQETAPPPPPLPNGHYGEPQAQPMQQPPRSPLPPPQYALPDAAPNGGAHYEHREDAAMAPLYGNQERYPFTA